MGRQMKPQRMWAVIYNSGRATWMVAGTVRATRREAVDAMEALGFRAWPEWKSMGYRAVRVTVAVEPQP